MEKIIISCLESRVETNRRIYARFLLGPFKDDNAVTIATALRRSLLSKVKSVAITAIHIQGVTHEFSTIVGVRESVLDLALNFQQVILRTKTKRQRRKDFESFHSDLKTKKKNQNVNSLNKGDNVLAFDNQDTQKDKLFLGGSRTHELLQEVDTVQVGYLQVQGPAVVYANDLKLPQGIECVDPTQYIATLSTDSLLVVKFLIGKKKISFDKDNAVSYDKQKNIYANAKQDFASSYTKTKFWYALTNRTLFKKPSTLEKVEQTFAYKNQAPWKQTVQQSFEKQEQNSLLQLENPVEPVQKVGFRSFDPTTCLRNTIFLDPIFDSVLQANYVIEKDDLFNQVRERILIEFWTNGSIHPRQALHKASLSLISTFSIFRKVFHLDSL